MPNRDTSDPATPIIQAVDPFATMNTMKHLSVMFKQTALHIKEVNKASIQNGIEVPMLCIYLPMNEPAFVEMSKLNKEIIDSRINQTVMLPLPLLT